MVTSNWVKELYVRDGINSDIIEVLPVGCDTDAFTPCNKDDPKILAVREALGVSPDQIMILTVGGDSASKGAQEVMQALAIICLLYTSDAADDLLCVDLGGRRIIKK